MFNWWHQGWYWIYLTFFKTRSLEKQAATLSETQALQVFLQAYCVLSLVSLACLSFVGLSVEVLGYTFNWDQACQQLVGELVGGLVFGLGLVLFDEALVFVLGLVLVVGLSFGLLGGLLGRLVEEGLVGGLSLGLILMLSFGLLAGLGLGLILVLSLGLVVGLVVGLFEENLVVGLVVGLVGGLVGGLVRGLVGGVVVGVVVGLVGGLVGGLSESIRYALYYLIIFIPSFAFVYFRPLYIPIHLWQYQQSKNNRNPFPAFNKSPIQWDEMIHMPLPYMQAWLVHLARYDQAQGIAAIEFIANERPIERKAAFKALVIILGDDLTQTKNLPDLFKLKVFFKRFPNEDKALPVGLNDARQHFNRISELAQDYLNRQTLTGQQQVLKELQTQLQAFHDLMKLTPTPVGTTFQPHAARWLQMLAAEQTQLQAQAEFNPLPNPYIAGNPLQARDQHLFVGRRDLLLALEEHILNTQQKPSLLLYGRRRTGKSSTLLNLPQSRFESVYIDCQDSRWHESDQAFCYNLAKAVFETLFKSGSLAGLHQPKLEQYEKNTFTQLDTFLEAAQKLAEQRSKRILLAFDEYEALEDAVINQYISERVLGKLRNLIQHHPMIVVLVSGSHRFEELPRINWANYLINTHLLELSFLAPSAARELLTQPVPELRYAEGVVETIIQATHCQPYLLQMVASELVNYLNSQKRSLASLDDLELAFSKILKSASAYFTDTWRKDNSPEEQAILRALAQGNHLSETNAALLQGLIRKELVERVGDTYQLAVPLFARWIRENQ